MDRPQECWANSPAHMGRAQLGQEQAQHGTQHALTGISPQFLLAKAP